jgi:hypothetical protein
VASIRATQVKPRRRNACGMIRSGGTSQMIVSAIVNPAAVAVSRLRLSTSNGVDAPDVHDRPAPNTDSQKNPRNRSTMTDAPASM